MNIDELRKLAGINEFKGWTQYTPENLSISGSEKQHLEKKHSIKPGTKEWFKLWFAKPHLTGEKSI